LAAGVVEDGNWSETLEGSPLGASVSPLLANVYLHYVFDRWGRSWRRRHARGDIVVTRFADDFVVGFQHLGDAKRFLSDLRERFGKFNLELHPDKTRLIEFGRFAVSNRNSVVLGSRRRSSSWASRPFAGRRRTDGSGSGGSQQVEANKGAPGVDEQSIEAFESDLKNNLYKVWNRRSSGTYFPPAVRAVSIPKP
jgi:retron-type reverse transcriptase